MKDREIIIYMFLGIGLILLILGIFYRKWNLFNRLKPRKPIAKFIREILGERGSQIWIFFISITFFLLPGLYLSYLQYVRPHLPAEYSQKTDGIALRHIMKPNKIDDGWIRSAPITWTTVDKIKDQLRYSDLDSYDSISFKDNYLDELPNFVWNMKNLKCLYLKNNKIKVLPIEKIKNTDIKTIYIMGNPFTDENIHQIKELGIDINNEK
jgi:Leucine-rich repeat (LRR) protein